MSIFLFTQQEDQFVAAWTVMITAGAPPLIDRAEQCVRGVRPFVRFWIWTAICPILDLNEVVSTNSHRKGRASRSAATLAAIRTPVSPLH